MANYVATAVALGVDQAAFEACCDSPDSLAELGGLQKSYREFQFPIHAHVMVRELEFPNLYPTEAQRAENLIQIFPETSS